MNIEERAVEVINDTIELRFTVLMALLDRIKDIESKFIDDSDFWDKFYMDTLYLYKCLGGVESNLPSFSQEVINKIG